MNSFDKIIGYEAEKKELYQIIDTIKNKEKYDEFGAKLPKGILLFGNPGLGKTMLAEAFISECDIPAFSFRKNDDDAKCIADINNAFKTAKYQGKAIIFFDDLDKFCDKDDECRDCKIFNNIQKNIDSVKDDDVIILATANDWTKLPASLVRNGRFDRKIHIASPDDEDAKKIIQYYLSQKKIKDGIDFNDVSKMVDYSSCVDLETIANDAALICGYKNKKEIDIDDIAEAYLKQSFLKTEKEKKDADMKIYHEIGHVVIAEVLKEGGASFVTVNKYINQRKADRGGFTKLDNDLRRPELILVSLGGKAASELFYDGSVASGCVTDLTEATKLLKDGMESNSILGFSVLNPCDFSNSSNYLYARQEAFINAELERYYYMAKKILFENKEFYFKLVEALKKKDYLFFSEIQQIRHTCNIKTFYAF